VIEGGVGSCWARRRGKSSYAMIDSSSSDAVVWVRLRCRIMMAQVKRDMNMRPRIAPTVMAAIAPPFEMASGKAVWS
jgi:hypothetical protein